MTKQTMKEAMTLIVCGLLCNQLRPRLGLTRIPETTETVTKPPFLAAEIGLCGSLWITQFTSLDVVGSLSNGALFLGQLVNLVVAFSPTKPSQAQQLEAGLKSPIITEAHYTKNESSPGCPRNTFYVLWRLCYLSRVEIASH